MRKALQMEIKYQIQDKNVMRSFILLLKWPNRSFIFFFSINFFCCFSSLIMNFLHLNIVAFCVNINKRYFKQKSSTKLNFNVTSSNVWFLSCSNCCLGRVVQRTNTVCECVMSNTSSSSGGAVCDVFDVSWIKKRCLNYFPFRQPFGSSHRTDIYHIWTWEEDTINRKHIHTSTHAHIQRKSSSSIDSRAILKHILHSAHTFTTRYRTTSLSVEQTTDASVRAHKRAFDMIFSAFFFTSFYSVYMSSRYVDSGEFILKLNASLNNSLVQVSSVYSSDSSKRIFFEQQSHTKYKKKKRSGKKLVQFATSVNLLLYRECVGFFSSSFICLLFLSFNELFRLAFFRFNFI